MGLDDSLPFCSQITFKENAFSKPNNPFNYRKLKRHPKDFSVLNIAFVIALEPQGVQTAIMFFP